MRLNKGDQVITAFAESASGPGWSNTPVWVIIRSKDGKLRQDCLQPEEQSTEIRQLFGISQACHLAMLKALTKRKKP